MNPLQLVLLLLPALLAARPASEARVVLVELQVVDRHTGSSWASRSTLAS